MNKLDIFVFSCYLSLFQNRLNFFHYKIKIFLSIFRLGNFPLDWWEHSTFLDFYIESSSKDRLGHENPKEGANKVLTSIGCHSHVPANALDCIIT